MPFERGPYVQAACFCDMVLRSEGGVLSLIRVIDRLTHTETGPAPPEQMPAVSYPMNLVVMLKSGRARGRRTLRLVPELPSGETLPELTFTVHFEGEEKGQNVIMRPAFAFPLEGLYWFRIYLGDEELTAIPFRVRYNRTALGSTSG